MIQLHTAHQNQIRFFKLLKMFWEFNVYLLDEYISKVQISCYIGLNDNTMHIIVDYDY